MTRNFDIFSQKIAIPNPPESLIFCHGCLANTNLLSRPEHFMYLQQKKKMFSELTPPHWVGMLANMTFLCRCGYFKQYQAKYFFSKWPFQTVGVWEKWDFLCQDIDIFHVIFSKRAFFLSNYQLPLGWNVSRNLICTCWYFMWFLVKIFFTELTSSSGQGCWYEWVLHQDVKILCRFQ